MYEQTGVLVKNKFKEHLLPTVLTTLALSLATMVDSIIVGQLLGSESLAAIGLGTPIIYVINIIYVVFAAGGMMCASVARGRMDLEGSNRRFTMGIVGGVAVMVIFLIVMLLAMDPISMMLVSSDEAADAFLVKQYLRPLVFTGPFLILSNGVALFMRADGKPKSSAMIVIISNLINLVLDFCLIAFLDTGIMGAGLSTTLGYVGGVMVVMPYLLNRKGIRNFRFVRIPNVIEILKDVVKAGLPKGCTYIAAFGRSLILNSLVMTIFGMTGMTVLTVLLNVLTLATIFVSGTGDTLLPIVGTLYGEKDTFGIRKTVESARNTLVVACIAIMVFFVVGYRIIGMIFGLSAPEEYEMLRVALWMFAVYVPFYALVTTLQNFYNVTGRVQLAVVSSILDGLVYVCGFAFLLSAVKADLLWLCYGCGSALTFFTLALLAKGIQKRDQVEGLLLLRVADAGEQVWNMTIDTEQEQVLGLTHAVVEFCKEHQVDDGLTQRLGIGIEEMAMASIQHAHRKKQGKIDLMIRVNDRQITMRFRDDGSAFDPVVYEATQMDGFVTDGVAVLRAMASDISYSNQLGFNITVLTFERRIQDGE